MELLFGFDNAMDMVGWYTNSGIDAPTLVPPPSSVQGSEGSGEQSWLVSF